MALPGDWAGTASSLPAPESRQRAHSDAPEPAPQQGRPRARSGSMQHGLRLPVTDDQLKFLRVLVRLLSDLLGCPHSQNGDYKLRVIKDRIAEDEDGFRRLCAIIGASKLSRDEMPQAQLPGAASAADIKAMCDALVYLSLDELKIYNCRTLYFTLSPKRVRWRTVEQDKLEQGKLFEDLGLGQAAAAEEMCKRSLQELLQGVNVHKANAVLQDHGRPTAESVACAVRSLAAPMEHLCRPDAMTLLSPHAAALMTISQQLQQVLGQHLNPMPQGRAQRSESESAAASSSSLSEAKRKRGSGLSKKQMSTQRQMSARTAPALVRSHSISYDLNANMMSASVPQQERHSPVLLKFHGGEMPDRVPKRKRNDASAVSSSSSHGEAATIGGGDSIAGWPPYKGDMHVSTTFKEGALIPTSSSMDARVRPPFMRQRQHEQPQMTGEIDGSMFNLPPRKHESAESSASQGWLSPREGASGAMTNTDNFLQLQSDDELAFLKEIGGDGDDDDIFGGFDDFNADLDGGGGRHMD